jgi:signal transduction histidine kinase
MQEKTREPRLSRLRTRLGVALLLAFVPIFVLIVVAHREELRDRRESRIQSLEAINQTIAASLDGFARDLATFSQSAGITVALTAEGGAPLNQSTLGPYFVQLAQTYGVRSIFITGEDGRVLAGTAGNIGFDVSSRAYFQALRAGKEEVWSGALAGQESGQTTLAYGRVVKGTSGQRLAYLFVAFYPPRLSDRLPLGLPEDANVSLIDNGGIMLLSTEDLDLTRPTVDVSGSEVFNTASSGQSITVRDGPTPTDSGNRYGVFVPVKSTGWVVGLTRPASAVDGPLESRYRRDLLIIAAAFLIAFAAVMALSSRLIRPLTDLAASASLIARGEAPPPVRPASDRDVHELQQAMTAMASAIESREERLREETRAAERLSNQLARLHASRNALATLMPPDEITAVVVREAMGATGATTGAVVIPDDETSQFRLSATAGYAPEVNSGLDGLSTLIVSPMSDALKSSRVVSFSTAEELIRNYPATAHLKRGARTEAGAFLPLRVEGKVLGVLLLGFSEQKAFAQDELDLMFAFANQAAQALHRATLYDESQKARAELSRSIEAKDEFLGMLAHEMRTPITTIYGSARLLNSGRPFPEEARSELIAGVEQEADRLAKLIENLLLLARLEVGQQPAQEQIIISKLVSDVLINFHRSYPGRHVDLVCSESLSVVSEPVSLGQVLFNLLTNAAKYTQTDSPIEVFVESGDSRVVFHVRDRGAGVASEELNLIFQSFYRSADASRTAPGQGIGLAVCRRLVESMGGEIVATPRIGGGLDVNFWIPVRSADET